MAKLLPIPRKFTNAGIRRFGFHGLSYTYLMDRLTTLDPQAAAGRVILAHLGNGASMSAVLARKPIDTTMSFTPIAGLVMGTRSGDLDPGLLVNPMKEQNLSAQEMDDFISSRCGLLAISETSADMRDPASRCNATPAPPTPSTYSATRPKSISSPWNINSRRPRHPRLRRRHRRTRPRSGASPSAKCSTSST